MSTLLEIFDRADEFRKRLGGAAMEICKMISLDLLTGTENVNDS